MPSALSDSNKVNLSEVRKKECVNYEFEAWNN